MSDETGNELHNRFAEKWQEKEDLEVSLKNIKKELEVMSEALVDKFLNEQVQKISLKGGTTLRLDCRIWPKMCEGKTAADAVAAIKAAGMPELLVKEGVQTNSLAAYLRDLDKSGDPLPLEFEGIISPNPVYKIIATKH
jgi:hypothetical protein